MSREQSWLEVIEVPEDRRVLACLRGELDLASAATVTERLRRLPERRENVLLDLDEHEFIDMSGFRALLPAAERDADERSAFKVTRGSRAVRRLRSLVQVDSQLPVYGRST